jgi:hypothetical protein
METLLSMCVGIGLSAACGFRVFVPLFVMSLASRAGHLALSPGFEWIGTSPALVAFGIATCLEIAGYYIPWVDNVLDTIATPAAIVAGIIVTASAVSGMSPFLKWALAVIAGGGAAATVQVATGMMRGASSLTTAGLGNPLITTLEVGGAMILSLLAIVLPVLAGLVVLGILAFAAKKVFERQRRYAPPVPASEQSGQ